jgi:hypothetical protein
MRCRDALARSTAYVDGELDERHSRAVRGHLRGCPRCADAFAAEAAMRDGLGELEPIEPPATLWRDIEARMGSDEIAEASRSPLTLALLSLVDRLRQRVLASAVVVTAAVLAVVWLERDRRAPPVATASRVAVAVAASVAGTAAPAPTPTPAPIASTESFEDAAARELVAGVEHHEAALAELEHDIAGAGSTTPRVRRALAAARAEIAAARAALPASDAAPRVMAAYRDAIALHARVAAGRTDALALARRGRR